MIILILFSGLSFAQIGTAKVLTTADSVYDIVCLDEWLEVAVLDTGAADTITVWYPYTNIAGTASYAVLGTIKEVATSNNVVGLYGDADTKVYIFWVPYPRAVRFLLSDYASGNVEIKPYKKP